MESANFIRSETANKTQTQENGEKQSIREYIQITFAIAAIVISIMAAIVLEVFVSRHQQRKSLQETSSDSGQHCLKCSTLSHKLSSDDNPLMTKFSKKTGEDNVEMCCATTPEEWSALMKILMWNSENNLDHLQTFYPANFTFSAASLHKRLLPSNFQPELDVPKFLDNDENVTLIFDPYEIDPLTEHVREVELMQTQAVILQPGLYYIYSSVLFKPDSAKPCKDYKRQSWDHNIVLTRNNDKINSQIIFRSVHTCCDECIRHKATSYTGGTLFLQQNDGLHVEVSGYSLVSFRREGSFFGMMMLNNSDFQRD